MIRENTMISRRITPSAPLQIPLSPFVIAPAVHDAILFFSQQRLCSKSCPPTLPLLHKFLDPHSRRHHLRSERNICNIIHVTKVLPQHYLCCKKVKIKKYILQHHHYCKSPSVTSSILQKKVEEKKIRAKETLRWFCNKEIVTERVVQHLPCCNFRRTSLGDQAAFS